MWLHNRPAGREGGRPYTGGRALARPRWYTVHCALVKGETLTVTAVEPIIGSFEVMVLGPQAKDRLPVTVRGTLL